jgi:predicted ATPase
LVNHIDRLGDNHYQRNGIAQERETRIAYTPNTVSTGGSNSPGVVGDGTTINYYPPPSSTLPETHDTIGYIPPYKGTTYVPRGPIENDVREMLRTGGVGTIVGLKAPGGLGKTELAKRAAHEAVKEKWLDDMLWVDVGDKTAPQVVADMLTRCGIKIQPNTDYLAQVNELRSYLSEHRLLVVLDDVRTTALDGMDDFVPPRPCVTLITSRIQDVGVMGRIFELDHMTDAQARDLFAAVLKPETINAEQRTLDELAEYCKYNPLALEIVARRIHQMESTSHPVATYLEMLRARFAELQMDGDKRWDMRAIFDLSYNDLNEDDQKRFRLLGAFHHTGFTLEAASSIWGDDPDAAKILSRFINLSLVKFVEKERLPEGSGMRYRLHDLLDQYAMSKLQENDEYAAAHQSVTEWLARLFYEHYTDDPSTHRN